MRAEKAVLGQVLLQNRNTHGVQKKHDHVLMILRKISVRERKRRGRVFRAEVLENGACEIDETMVIVRK